MMELIGYSHYSKNYNPLVKPGGKENVQYRYSNRFLPNVGFEYRFARTKKNRIVYFDYHRTAIAGVYAGGGTTIITSFSNMTVRKRRRFLNKNMHTRKTVYKAMCNDHPDVKYYNLVSDDNEAR